MVTEDVVHNDGGLHRLHGDDHLATSVVLVWGVSSRRESGIATCLRGRRRRPSLDGVNLGDDPDAMPPRTGKTGPDALDRRAMNP